MRPKRPPLKASFLAPAARTTRIVATAACPDCKSTNIKFLLNANTCELVQMLDHTMMKCGGCDAEFAADYVAALAALATKNPSGTISEDLVCPECRGTIQGQRAGTPCGTCGSLIPEHMAMSRRMSQGVNPWRFIIPAMLGVLILGAVYMFAPPLWSKVSLFGVFALLELWQGIYGLATRRIEQRNGRTLTVHRGAKAVLISIAHLFAAAVLVGVAWAVHGGVFDRMK